MAETKLTVDDYLFLDELLQYIGYGDIKKKHKSKDIFRLKLEAPRNLQGSEAGKKYSNNGYSSIIWTSFLLRENKFRDVGKDIGWPIITMNDELVYSATPIPRDENFIFELARYAWVNKWKIDNIPLCPCKTCNARMLIYRKPGTRQYMYICRHTEQHDDGKFRFRPWDYGLPPIAKQFVELKRLSRAMYRDRNKQKGIEPIPKAVKRKRWIVNAPENVIPARKR